MTLALAASALAVAPVALPLIGDTTSFSAAAGEGNFNCAIKNGSIAYSIIDRNAGLGRYTFIRTDIVYGELEHCKPNTSVFSGYPQAWLSAQDYEGSGSGIVQVGYQDCGDPAGCYGGQLAYKSSGFVYSSRDNDTGGALTYWTGGPNEVFGHEYRMTISEANASQWSICIVDLTVGSANYCKVAARTDGWAMDYAWWGCEAHNVGDYCGTDSDSGTQLQFNRMQYHRSDTDTTYTIDGSATVCEFPTGGTYNYVGRKCVFNANRDTVTIQALD
jgi:hypothetical protein